MSQSPYVLSVGLLVTAAGLATAEGPPSQPRPDAPSLAPAPIATWADGPLSGSLDSGRTATPSFWIGAEYLLWWTKDAPLPVPIASTVLGQAAVPLDVPNAGALGVNGTQVLSPNTLDAGSFSGVRIGMGLWLDCDQSLGVEGGGFLLPTHSASFNTISTLQNGPALLVPFFNAGVSAPGESAFPLGGQGQAAGRVSATNSTELWGVAGNGLLNILRDDRRTLTLLAGIRYLDLHEDLGLGFSATSPDGPILAFGDEFSTRNQFWGGNLGARGEVRFGRAFADVSAQLALGDMHESVSISGVTTFAGAPGGFQNGGGFFAQPSNTGRRTSDVFAVVPEVGVQVGYDLTHHLRAFIGYDFLYASDVVRPGDQIDRRINPSQFLGGTLVGPAAPLPLFNHTDFWAQGVTFGLALQF